MKDELIQQLNNFLKEIAREFEDEFIRRLPSI
ncbi:hypothetical protein OXPF_01080 [Oxobacter pfennigii]|uniref:Uncharacterized protein n=1 Tax=Oxobacter pfennigii TaxID=36849 RepID=A0A0P8Z284_9CLOT|nr:hypothetical protein OXPF_01080 [Oxobacter pfennigii]